MKIFKKMKNRNNSFHKSRHKKKMIKTGHILNLFYSTQIVTNVWAGFKLGIVSVTSNNFVRVPSLLYKIIRYYFAWGHSVARERETDRKHLSRKYELLLLLQRNVRVCERLKNIWATCFQTDLLIFLPRFFNSHVCVFDIAVDVVLK